MHDNLYLISEAVKVSLFQFMPYLIDCNLQKQLVSVIVTKELTNILYNMICFYDYWINHASTKEEDQEAEEVDLEIEQVFIQQDGSIKYCPRIVSPLRNYDPPSAALNT